MPIIFSEASIAAILKRNLTSNLKPFFTKGLELPKLNFSYRKKRAALEPPKVLICIAISEHLPNKVNPYH